MTLSASIVLYKALVKILLDENGNERDLPFNIKYKLLRSKSMLEKDAILYDNARIKLIEKFGITPETQLTEEVQKEFFEEIKKVLIAEVDHDFKKLSVDEVGLIDIRGISNDETELFMVLLVDDPELVNDLQTPITDLNGDGEVGVEPANE